MALEIFLNIWESFQECWRSPDRLRQQSILVSDILSEGPLYSFQHIRVLLRRQIFTVTPLKR